MVKTVSKWILITTFIFLQFVVNAQTKNDWYLNKPIREIRFKGLKTTSQDDMNKLLKDYIGKRFTVDLFIEMQNKIYSLDYFEDVKAESALPADEKKEGVIIVFSVKEKAYIDDIVIEGNVNIRKPNIKEKMESKIGTIFSKPKIEGDMDAIKALYSEKGFGSVDVTYKTEDVDKGNGNSAIKITVTVQEGKQVFVKTIEFVGNSAFSTVQLKRRLKTKERGFLDSGIFETSTLQDDEKNLKDFYTKRGYIDFRLLDTVTENLTPEKGEEGSNPIKITYTVSEGELWYFGDITFSGNTVFTSQELKNQVLIKSDGRKVPVDISKIESAYFRIGQLYSQKGYIFNQMKTEEKRDDNEKIVNYNLAIVENGKAYINDIIITGNKITKDFVIRRELPFKEGDPFDSTKLQDAYLNLYNLRFFDTIDFDHVVRNEGRLIDLIISVKEKRTIEALGGLRLGGDSFVGGYISLNEINLAGLGITLGGGVDLSVTKQELSLNYGQNWLFGSQTSLSSKLFFSHSQSSKINNTNLPQDVENPIFSGNAQNSVPDPYKGYYVFSKDTSYNGKNYSAGDPFPTIPTKDEIKQYSLETDYQFANFNLINESTADYQEYTLGLSAQVGHTFVLDFLKKWSVSGTLGLDWNYVKYDSGAFRPLSAEIRDANKKWNFTPRVILETAIDGRDIYFSPTQGHYFRETMTMVFGKNKYYFKNDIKLQQYFKLADIKVYDNWSFKMVLKLATSLSLQSPLGKTFKPGSEEMYTDGMTTGRGWFNIPAQFIWGNTVELRVPIVEKYIWADTFFDAMYAGKELSNINLKKDWYFTFGIGLRSAIPQLPLGIYFGKLFYLDSTGKVKPNEDNIVFNKAKPTNSMAIIVTFGFDF